MFVRSNGRATPTHGINQLVGGLKSICVALRLTGLFVFIFWLMTSIARFPIQNSNSAVFIKFLNQEVQKPVVLLLSAPSQLCQNFGIFWSIGIPT